MKTDTTAATPSIERPRERAGGAASTGLSVQLRANDFEGGEGLLTPRENPPRVVVAGQGIFDKRDRVGPRAATPTLGTIRRVQYSIGIGAITDRDLVVPETPGEEVEAQRNAARERLTLLDLATALGRSALPEPGETFRDAARAAFREADPAALQAAAIGKLREVPSVDPSRWGTTIDVSLSPELECLEADEPDMASFDHELRFPRKSRSGLAALKLKGLRARVGRGAFDLGPDDPGAAARLAVETAVADPAFAEALLARVEAAARGPFDFAAIAGLIGEIHAMLQAHVPVDVAALDVVGSIVPRFAREAIEGDDPTRPLDLGALEGLDEGGGSFDVRAGDVGKRLAELHAKMPDADLSELVTHLDGGAAVTGGERPEGDAPADAARMALVLREPSDPQHADLVAGLAASSGFEVTVVNISTEEPTMQQRRDDAGRAVRVRVELGGAVERFVAQAMPGDAVLAYGSSNAGLTVLGRVAVLARTRGFHASVLCEGSTNAERTSPDGVAQAIAGEAHDTAQKNVPEPSARPDDPIEVCEEIFVTREIGDVVRHASPADVSLRQVDWVMSLLAQSRLFTVGHLRGALGGARAQLESDLCGTVARLHVSLLASLDPLRAELAQAAAGEGPGKAMVHTAVDDRTTPDANSFTTGALAYGKGGGDVGDAFAATNNGRNDMSLDGRNVGANGKRADGARRALVIGNSRPGQYIPGAVRDAQAMAARLAGERYEVDLELEAPRGVMSHAIHALGDGARDGERIYLYYAGHGGRDGLVGVDDQIVPNAVVAAATARARNAGAEVTTTIDACFSGGVANEAKAALGGYDHLPMFPVDPDDSSFLKGLTVLLGEVRDLYLVMSAGTGVPRDSLGTWKKFLAAAARCGLPAAELSQDVKIAYENWSGGPLSLDPRLITELWIGLRERIVQMRATEAKKRWLTDGTLPEDAG